MLFQFGFQSSLLLIFFVHGLVYAFLLFQRGRANASASDQWLSCFLLLCVLYISPWMLGFGGWYDNQPYRDFMFYMPFQHLYWIGPVIFFYVKSLLNPGFRFGKKELLHLLPGILYLLCNLVVVVTDNVILKRYYFLVPGTDPDFDTWYQLSGFLSMTVYFLLSLRYYNLYRRIIVQVISNADRVMFRWVRNFLLAFLLMLLLRLGFYISDRLNGSDYWNTWWYFLVFALIFYYIAIRGYANSLQLKFGFREQSGARNKILLLQPTPPALLPDLDKSSEFIEIETATPEQEGDKETLEAWKEKIFLHMQSGKSYTDPELSLTQLARELGTNPSFVSRMINKGFDLNFNDFINQFRIEAVKEMIGKGEHKFQTLLGIAFECGFNSKATFNRAFKKATGQTPRDWIGNQP